MPINLIIIIFVGLIAAVLVIFAVSGQFDLFGDSGDAFSPSVNSLLIGKCNGLCDVMQGKGGGVSGVILDRNSAVYSYCNELHNFKDAKGKKEQMSCVKAVEEHPELKINECEC